MHFAGLPSWSLSEDSSQSVLLALYLRDALGIDEPDDVPRLVPTIELAPHGWTAREHALLAQQWLWWWSATMDPQGHPSSQPLEMVSENEYFQGIALPREGFDELRRAVLEHGATAREWANRQHQEHGAAMMRRMRPGHMTVHRIVGEVENQLRRPVRPFRLRVEMAPFAEAGMWWVGNSAVLVSESLRDDESAYGEALRPVIARLA